MPTLTEHPTIMLAMQRLTALGWSVGGPLPEYEFSRVIARFQASTDSLKIDGKYGPNTASALFAPDAPRNTPWRMYPDLGRWCSYAQSIHSEKAISLGLLDNTPTPHQYRAMRYTYRTIIEPVFRHFGPGSINSFFRSGALQLLPGTKHYTSVNAIVGGSPTSNHTSGRAVDMDYDGVKGVSNQQVFDWVRRELPFFELISEDVNPNGSPRWTHIASNEADPNRRLIKRMMILGGKKKYQFWPW